MEDQKLGYEIRIGCVFDYYDTEKSEPIRCEIYNIINDGHYVIYEFFYFEMSEKGYTSRGSTIFPSKLKQIK